LTCSQFIDSSQIFNEKKINKNRNEMKASNDTLLPFTVKNDNMKQALPGKARKDNHLDILGLG